MMKKFSLILLAVLLVFSLAFVGCGSSGNGDPDPDPDTPIDLPDTLDVPANFEYDSAYTPPGQGWAGGPNPAKPKGYQTMIYPFTSAIVAGDVFEITMKFKLSRAVENIELTIVDTASNAAPNAYWTDLTVTYPRPDPEPDGPGKFDNDEEGLEADTEYDFEVTYIILHPSKGAVSGDDANVGINFYIEAEHLDTYTLVADAADDIITITFVEFEVVKNPEPGEGELTGPQLAAKAIIEGAFDDFEDEITELVGDISDWEDEDWLEFFDGLEEGELEAILAAIDLLLNPPPAYPVDLGAPFEILGEAPGAAKGWKTSDDTEFSVSDFAGAKYLVIVNPEEEIGMIIAQDGIVGWNNDVVVDNIVYVDVDDDTEAWIPISDIWAEGPESWCAVGIGKAGWGGALDCDSAYLTDQDPPEAP